MSIHLYVPLDEVLRYVFLFDMYSSCTSIAVAINLITKLFQSNTIMSLTILKKVRQRYLCDDMLYSKSPQRQTQAILYIYVYHS